MGIYDLYMGKGLIIPVEYFVRKYIKEIKADFPELSEMDDATDVLNTFVKKHIGDYRICSVGHDALEVRGGTGIIGGSDNQVVVRFIEQWRLLYGEEKTDKNKKDKNKKPKQKRYNEEEDEEQKAERELLDSMLNTPEQQSKEDVPIANLHVGDLMFIGKMEQMESDDGEFSYYVKAPEIIYGLASLLDSIVEKYPTLKASDCTSLEKAIGFKSCIWTFAPDCACCG